MTLGRAVLTSQPALLTLRHPEPVPQRELGWVTSREVAGRGSEACDEESGLPTRELVPVSCVREWLGEHRPGDDDVDRGGVWSDGPVAASTGEDLLEEVPDLGLKRDDLPVMDDGAAPWRGRISSLRAAIVCSKNCSSVSATGWSLSAAGRACCRTRWKERNVRAAKRPDVSGSGGRGFRSRRPPRRRSSPSALSRGHA